MSAYPEHDKLQAISGQSQVCGEFFEWLTAQGIVMAKYHFHTDKCHTESSRRPSCGMSAEMLYPEYRDIQKLLAEFFNIDRAKLEAEKRAMLTELRSPAPAALPVSGESGQDSGSGSMAAGRVDGTAS